VPHAETATNGAGEPSTPAAESDFLKGIDAKQIAFWQRMNYSPERMKEEAKFYKRTYRGAPK
jgi:hypothetical protein